MANFGRTVAGFLLLWFCLCSFYQPCHSDMPKCYSTPLRCKEDINDIKNVCSHLKDNPLICTLPPINSSKTAVCDNIANITAYLHFEITDIKHCKAFCFLYPSVCNYIYIIGFANWQESITKQKMNADTTKLMSNTTKYISTTPVLLKQNNITSNNTLIRLLLNSSKHDDIDTTNLLSSVGNQNVSRNEPVLNSNTSNLLSSVGNQNVSGNGPVLNSNTSNLQSSVGNQNVSGNGPVLNSNTSNLLSSVGNQNVSGNGPVLNSNTSNLLSSVGNQNVSGNGPVLNSNTSNFISSVKNLNGNGSVLNSNTNGLQSSVGYQNVNGNGPVLNSDNNLQSGNNLNGGYGGDKSGVSPKKTPMEPAYNEAPSSAHFMGYFLTAIVLCIAGYIVFHNKQKIIAFIIEGRNQKRGRRPNVNEYKKLQTNVDDVMVSLDKSTTAQNYIY